MRQVEYRCYHIVKKQYLDLLAIDFTYAIATVMEIVCEIRFSEIEVAPNYIETSYGFDEVILEQFTGLPDKDGKKIYEGDVYAHDDGLVEVVWDNQSSCFECQFIKDRESSIPVFEIAFLSLIYCGNIHEKGETK